MEYKIKKKEDVQINVIIPWTDAEKEFDNVIATASKNVSVKGFRKGSVPQEIAEAQVDRAKALSEAVDHLLREYYADIINKESLKVVGAPRVSVTKLAENNDVEVKIVVSVLPEIELPKKWKGEIKKINNENSGEREEISDEKVKEELKHLAASRAQHNEVDRAAKKGDHVKIDFTVKQDGVIIENGTSKDHSLVLGKGVFIPGFEEEVIGMKKDDEKTFELTFPKEYHASHLAGKKAEFDVKVNVVEERIIPEIDDVFAKSLGEQFKTLDDLKASVKDGMEKEQKKKYNEEKRTKYLDAFTEMIDVNVPHAVLHDELHRMVGEFEQQLSMSGMQFDEYLIKINKTREEIEKEWEPQAKKRVLSALILEQIANEEEINIDSKDIEEEMNKTLAMYKGVKDMEKNIDMGQLYEYTKGVMRNDKVFEMLEKL
ncbi:MAG: trigger factor [Candidatus Moraniibacteriota bacterium]|nr:MAG: trigger factor [Candidatus Moranbacteria bacterium]